MNIKNILGRNKLRFGLTFMLLALESFIGILLPLFIGFAVDGALKNDFTPIYYLGGLGVALILIGGFRRLYDSRFYGRLYKQLSGEMLEKNADVEPSLKTARLNMLTEVTEFLENQVPALIQHTLGLVGVAFVISSLNLNIFLYALAASLFVMLVYWFSSRKTIDFNKSFNNEMEAQVDVISNSFDGEIKSHIARLININIKLSDLETINFSLSWLAMTAFLLLSIVVAISDGITEYGALFALIMYVYQYIESVVSLPLFYQQWLRLKEILGRLSSM